MPSPGCYAVGAYTVLNQLLAVLVAVVGVDLLLIRSSCALAPVTSGSASKSKELVNGATLSSVVAGLLVGLLVGMQR